MNTPLVVLFAVFVGSTMLGAPVALAMIAGGIAYLGVSGQDMGLAAEQILNGLFGGFILIAVPMFIFAANLMNAGTISDRIFAFAHALLGRVRGGLAHVNVLVSVIFSGMSGSAIADAVGPGLVEVRMMTKDGHYPTEFAVAVSAASATIGPIIPPSIPLLLYAMLSGASVGALFVGGVVPGLLMAASMSAVIVWVARRRDYPRESATPWRQLPRLFVASLPPMLLPLLLLGGIYSGAFTPTEAAAVAAFYALLLGVLVYRAIDGRGLLTVLLDSSRQTASVGLIICGAYLLNYALAAEHVPDLIAGWFAGREWSPLEFLLLVNLVFLILGCLFDTTTLLLVLVPLVLPVAREVGVDLVHLGVVLVVNMMIGLITPPYGVLLFIYAGLTRTPTARIVRELWPFLGALLVILLLITVWPDLVLALPRELGY